jgi:hypothetical protein
MIRKTGFLWGIFLLAAFAAQGQKVKYKDLFLLLSAKEYDKAEPFLKKYLKDNDDNPNAYLFMGIIYHEKSGRNDVLKQTSLLTANIDSALIFYDKAFKTITEKEIRRNDEYYEMYKRRDLRTGDFGIKISDVTFDIEKRIQGLKERKDRIRLLKEQFVQAESSYQLANVRFKKIQSSYPGLKEFYLQSSEKTSLDLKQIISSFDSCTTAFSNYKTTSQLLGKTGYTQVLELRDIQDFKKDGNNLADFTKDDLKLWDYKKWAQTASDVLEKDISPIRDLLASTDLEINKLQAKVKKDSVSVKGEAATILQRPLLKQLTKYDEQPLPLEVFEMKVAELDYASDLILSRSVKDSANVNLHLVTINQELKSLRKLDSLAGLLSKKEIDKDAENYKHFISSAYGTLDVLKNQVQETKAFASRELIRKEREWEIRIQSLKWIVVAKDSIPLFTDATLGTSKFKPQVIVPEDYTLGIKYADSVATGYFYSITPSRIPDIKVNFPLGSGFKKRNLPLIKALATRDEKKQVYFGLIYSEAKVKEKFTVIIAKIYRTDGLAWSRTFQFDHIPTGMTYVADAAELSVKVTSASGDHSIIVIDKTGKQLQ